MSEMKLYYNNADIYKNISMNYCVHEMNAGKRSDSLTIKFNDVSSIWSVWNPDTSDIIRVKYGNTDSGDMYIHSVTSENGIFTLRALSVPPGNLEKKSRDWEKIRLTRLVAQIAEENGLSYQLHGVDEQVYSRIVQDNETDFAFLDRICECESCCFMVYDKTIVVYSEPYMESRNAGTLEVGENGKFHYSKIYEKYKTCRVVNGKFSGEFSTDYGKGVLNITDLKPLSSSEAIRLSKAMLRKYNKDSVCGKITKSIVDKYSAASVVNLKTVKASAWEKKMFITSIRNNYLENRSDIYFRECLEGY